MNIQDINNLNKINGSDIYDLTNNLFEFKTDIQYFEYRVQKGEEMRIDLVCHSIYNNIDNIDILLNYNNINNPLNIKEGTLIRYPISSSISEMRLQNKNDKESLKVLSNPLKSNRNDKNRVDYVDSNYSLPPTILQSSVDQVKITNNNINLGDGLFNK